MARVSGVPILGIVKFIKKNLKGESIDDLLRMLEDQEDREVLQKRVLPTEWYPYRTYVNLLKLVDKHFGRGDLSFAREMGRMAADSDLTGIYRAFLKLGPTKFLMKRVMNMWKGYYDSGKIELIEVEEKKAHVKVSDFQDIKKVHCKSIEGWIERFLELGGAKGVQVREIKCRSEGAPFCLYEVNYESL